MSDKCDLCLLGMIILSSLLTGTTGAEVTDVFISSGENVRLSCNNALSDCTTTTWIYNRFRHSWIVEIITLGKKKKDTESHERLSLESDCSLNIKNVTKDDSGFYNCQQYVNGQKQGTDAHVYLHVLHVSPPPSSQTEISPGRSVTLSCQLYSVSCDDWVCSEGLHLLWVNQAGVDLKTDSRYQISAPDRCIITLTTTLLNEDDNREWRCQLTQRDQVKTSARYTGKNSGTVGAEVTDVFISSGENVRLSCNNALSDCKSTTWIHSRFRDTWIAEMITLGKKNEDTESHERLSLGSDCSLNIKHVTQDDYGFYTCQKYVNGQQETDARVYLHVLHVSVSPSSSSSSSPPSSQTEISPDRSVTLSCQLYSVSCDDWVCSEGLQLLWVNQAGVDLKTDSRYQISAPDHCNINLTTTLLNEDDNREWRCQLTHRNQLKASARYTGITSTTATALIPVIVIVAAFAVLFPALIVCVIRKKRADPKEEECDPSELTYVNYSVILAHRE
ncbi:carcinoembryonic antigen-related cell adhesion molecule 1-like isoform X1 [Chanodichthys erythropterus]|uniref:carcinoembryonic antigen-related cell adhesion molecule 1-like isoform X1 n=1 Tax=Chanodichthys erythropterus TaxID=933992 RepID=UPI00351EE7AC